MYAEIRILTGGFCDYKVQILIDSILEPISRGDTSALAVAWRMEVLEVSAYGNCSILACSHQSQVFETVQERVPRYSIEAVPSDEWC